MTLPFPSRKQATSGFTLIEALVVVIMVAVLAAIAAPSWQAYLNRQRMTSVRSDLVAILQQAQADARQRRQTVTVEILDEDVPTVLYGIPTKLGSGNLNPGLVELDATLADGTAITELSFDYQGFPLVSSSAYAADQPLPWVINVSVPDVANRQCVIVANLLGSLKTAEGDTCNNPTVDPS